MIFKKNLIRQYFFVALLLSLGIAIAVRFPVLLGLIFGEGGERRHIPGGAIVLHFLSEFTITFIVALLMFSLNYFILKPLDRFHNLKTSIVLFSVGLTVVSVFLLNHLLFDVSGKFSAAPMGRGHKSEFDITNFFVSSLVIGCVIIYKIVYRQRSMSVEFERLKSVALQSQYESLKNQLSPHFLFNSLTALKILINESPSKAQEYVNSLSRALRYTLQSNEKQLVTLKEEIEFMESYLFLIRIRYDSNLEINMSIEEKYNNLRLPPLTIQTLVENAIKHNEISRRKPLVIDITASEDTILRVENPIQKKLSEEDGTGIGLTNLSRQYNLLIGKDITVKCDQYRFMVEIPLIK